MKVASNEFIDFLYYTKLPKVYRDYDRKVDMALYRYLQALIDGGYGYIITSVNNLLDIFNPSLCPKECLPYFCQSFGISYYDEIPEIYWRRLLSNIGEILHRRGTYSCIKYLVRALTGLDVLLYYKRGYNEDHTRYGRFLKATLQANDIGTIMNLEVTTNVVQKFIKEFVPHYITSVEVDAKIHRQLLQTNLNRVGLITNVVSAKLSPFVGVYLEMKTPLFRAGLISTTKLSSIDPSRKGGNDNDPVVGVGLVGYMTI